MISANAPSSILCLSLAILLWQGSSCHSSNLNMANNQARNQNANAAANADASRAGAPGEGVLGTWGGPHINLEVNESGGELNYDCAHGTINENIVPDGEGKFVVKGRHVKERPGPTREGDDQSGDAATYSGSINGETMSLTVALPERHETIGTFTLTKGRIGRIRKCM